MINTNQYPLCDKALLSAMARRHPRNTFMSAEFATDLLLREGESVSLEQVQFSMQKLQNDALGLLVKDEQDNMGFLWEQEPSVALARLNMGTDQFLPTIEISNLKVEDLRIYQDPLPEHVLQLRDNCAVRVALPKDLTEEDTQRVVHFVMSLVDSDSIVGTLRWPFPLKRPTKPDDEDEDDEFLDLV